MSTPAADVAEAPQQEAPRRKRGREGVGDMVRSLGLVLVIVLVAWWLAQPPDGDEQQIRVVDPAPAISELLRQSPGVPVPGALPAGWRPTVDAGTPDGLRLGWVTPQGQYAEYAVSVTGAPAFLDDITGRGTESGTFRVGAVEWRLFQGPDESATLVRTVGAATVAVGGLRETATLDELSELAASVQP